MRKTTIFDLQNDPVAAQVANYLSNLRDDYNDRVHADCPFCGKQAKRGQNHFTIYTTNRNNLYAECFVCGQKATMRQLAKLLGVDLEDEFTTYTYKRRPQVYAAQQHDATTTTIDDARTKQKDVACETTTTSWASDMEVVMERHAQELQRNPAIHDVLRRWGYTDSIIAESGIGYNSNWYKFDDTWIPAGILYPHRDLITNEIVMVHVRLPYRTSGLHQPDALAKAMRLEPAKSKYTSVKGSKGGLTNYGYVYRHHDNTDVIIFAEGEKDCDNIHRAVTENELTFVKAVLNSKDKVSASLQASGIIDANSRVLIITDDDEAGRAIKDALKDALSNTVHPLSIQSANVPVGKDPTDYAAITDHWALAEWIEERARLIPRIVRINEQFIANRLDLLVSHHLVGLDSPMGTGKTYAIGQLVKKHNLSALILTHRRSLNRNTAKRLADAGFKSQYDDDWQTSDRLVFTINSIDQLVDRQFDLIVIDEANQVAEHLLGNTFAKSDEDDNVDGRITGMRAHGILIGLCLRAKHIIYSNANLNDSAFALLTQLQNERMQYKYFDNIVVLNTYRKPKAPVVLYDHKDNLLDLILRNAAGEHPSLVVSDSVTNVLLYSDALRRAGYKVLTVHQDKIDTDEVIEFLKDPNVVVGDYDFVVASPTISSGFSIERPIANVYAINSGQVVTAETTVQQIGRARNVLGKVYAFIAKDKQQPNYVTWRDVASDVYRANETLHNLAIVQCESQGRRYTSESTVPAPHIPFWRMYCNVTAFIQNELQRLESSFLLQMYADGYTDITYADDDEPSQDIIDLKLQIKQDIADYERQKIMTVEPVDPDLERILRNNAKFDEDAQFGVIRYKVESAYCRTIDDDIYDHWHNACNRSLRPIAWFSNIALARQVLEDMDVAEYEQNRLAVHYNHYTARRHLLAGMLALLYSREQAPKAFLITPDNADDCGFTTKDADRLLEFCLSEDAQGVYMPELINQVFKVDPRKYKTSTAFLRAVLRNFGLSLMRAGQMYYIDKYDLARMLHYRTHRLEVREQLEDCDSAVHGLLVYARRNSIKETLHKKPKAVVF